jgi:hypothetical protein
MDDAASLSQSLKTGAGNNTLEVDMNSSDTSPTEFERAVAISFGARTNTGEIAFQHTNSKQAVLVLGSFVVTGAITNWEQDLSHELFPFGGSIVVK